MKYIYPLFLFAALLVSACVSQQPQPGAQQPEGQQPTGEGLGGVSTVAVRDFKVIIGHTFYSPNTFTVNKGDVVRFHANAAKGTGVESGFSHNHGITIDEFGVNQAVPTEDESRPVVIQFAADKAGEFRIYCKTCLEGPFGANHPAIQAALVVKG